MTNNQQKVKRLVLTGLLTAVLLILSYTPLGYLKIGLLEITLNVVPVAIAAISLGPAAGALLGTVFGLTSFGQCIGIGGLSPMGAALLEINPVFTFIMCLAPRILMGLLGGLVCRLLSKSGKPKTSFFITGFSCAFLNTLFFMSALVLLFGNTEYVQGLMGGKNVIVFICTFVGINAVFEMVASTLITGAVGTALKKAKLIH